MAYDSYDSSAAYDLSRFETHDGYARKEQEKQSQLRVVKHTGAAYRPAIAPIKIIAAMMAVMSVITLMIYNRVLLTELNDDISTSQKELTILEGENIRLQSELESELSMDSLESSLAGVMNKMGMTRITQDNVRYVVLADEETAVSDDGGQSGITMWINGMIDQIKSYLNG